jgi:hypothetical protein
MLLWRFLIIVFFRIRDHKGLVFFVRARQGIARSAFLARSALLARSTELGIRRSVNSDIGLQPSACTEHQLSRTFCAPGFQPPLQGPELCPVG